MLVPPASGWARCCWTAPRQSSILSEPEPWRRWGRKLVRCLRLMEWTSEPQWCGDSRWWNLIFSLPLGFRPAYAETAWSWMILRLVSETSRTPSQRLFAEDSFYPGWRKSFTFWSLMAKSFITCSFGFWLVFKLPYYFQEGPSLDLQKIKNYLNLLR